MWFIGVELEQETSAPPPKKILDPLLLKQQRRRRLRKRHLKSEFALHQTLSRLFHLVYFVKCWQVLANVFGVVF